METLSISTSDIIDYLNGVFYRVENPTREIELVCTSDIQEKLHKLVIDNTRGMNHEKNKCYEKDI